MPTIGIIGLGLLGSALAERLLGAKFPVVGYDTSSERRDALVAAGGRAEESAVATAGPCDTLLFSLPNADVVATVLAEIETSLRPGQLVIDTTTGEPLRSAEFGARLATRGAAFVDATVAGSSVQARAGQVVVMVGGEPEPFARARDVLACFAKQVFHVGPWGSGARMKLVVNLVLGLNRAVLAEGLSLARATQLDPALALEILRASPAYSTVMDTKGAKMLDEDFAVEARLSQHLKDVELILASAARTGARVPLSEVHRQLLARAVAEGCGELDNSAVIKAFCPRAS